MLRPRLHFVSSMRRNCERGADVGRRRRKSGSRSNENSPSVQNGRGIYIRYVFVVHADLWRKSHVGKTSSPSSIPSSVFSPSLPRSPLSFPFFLSSDSWQRSTHSTVVHLPIYLLPPTRNTFAISPLSFLAFVCPAFSFQSAISVLVLPCTGRKESAIGRQLRFSHYRPKLFPFL